MKRLYYILLGSIAFTTMAVAVQSVRLAWDHSPDAGVVGYHIYTGATSRNYTNRTSVGYTNQASISNLNDGTKYYFAATAFNSAGLESDYSNEAEYTTPGGNTNPPAALPSEVKDFRLSRMDTSTY